MKGNEECSENLKPKTGFAPESDSNSRNLGYLVVN